ncbi:MAG: peptidoglycan DD-metalloendopeptidase family protein, partial [Myxococcales bacterium]|nr:peptidoglycan DD-metalloendopeptidase family protein [Myxococcales bacterium]
TTTADTTVGTTTDVPPDTTTGEAEACDFVRVTGAGTDGLNVRAQPGLDAAVVGSLYEGQVVAALDQTLGDEVSVPGLGTSALWFRVETASMEGYVTALYAECTDEPPSAEWAWPVPLTGSIVQDFGNPIQYQSCGFHTGLDIVGGIGDPVVAASDGVVVHVGPMWFSGAGQGRGPYAIILQHGDGPLYSTYGHNDAALVVEGEIVQAGDLIAELGTLGYSSGPHLHFEILEGAPFTGDWQVPFADACDHYRDPKLYVQP